MNGWERTRDFLAGQSVDRVPFHPMVMRFVARHAGVPYRAFCLDPMAHSDAFLKTAADFGMDWVATMSDAYAEAEAYGLAVDYPENGLPQERGRLLNGPRDAASLRPLDLAGAPRLRNRVLEVAEFRRRAGDSLMVCGWVEGPFAEYADLRGLGEACLDLYDDPDGMRAALDFLLESAAAFALAQVEAGAHCIGIGDAACSQVGPDLYRDFCQPLEAKLTARIHAAGALVKLHICGNTTALLPDMLATGADIVDVDHLVPSLAPFVGLLRPGQAFWGKSDPVRVVQDGAPEAIRGDVRRNRADAAGRLLNAAGCEIPPDTPPANLIALRDA
jgi:uroporphyrinogen-III decarboxylase